LRKLVIHPFLFAVYPILFFFGGNIAEVYADELILPLVIATIVTLITFFSLRLIAKSYHKSGTITSFFLVLFFAYGMVRSAIISATHSLRYTYLVTFFLGLLWAILCILMALLVIRYRRNFFTLTKFLNIVAVVLVVISLGNIVLAEARASSLTQSSLNEKSKALTVNPGTNLPDIYYIILDEYARNSTLEEIYGYDNSEFTDFLLEKGFYVAGKSRSNYHYTFQSLASSLNMRYLSVEERNDRARQLRLIGSAEVARLLKSIGYRLVFVPSSMQFKGTDKYFQRYSPRRSVLGMKVGYFADFLIWNTALVPFQLMIGDQGRRAILDAFDALARIPDLQEPTFVFAHLLVPHPPFIFDSEGNAKRVDYIKLLKLQGGAAERYHDAYLSQLLFVNKKLKILIDEILARSEVKPIIILQADHGPVPIGQAETVELTHKLSMSERMDILNTYLFPDKDSSTLYDSVTPVNTFRVVFNLYFGADYELLKDESYYFNFELVPPED
jgi:hypothetical protein